MSSDVKCKAVNLPDAFLASVAVSHAQIDSVANVRSPTFVTRGRRRTVNRGLDRPYLMWKDDPDLARRVNDLLFEDERD